MALAAAFDPGNPEHILAGTTDGMLVSFNGGNTFAPHPDKKIRGEQFRQIMWDGRDPKTVFAITGEQE